MELNFTVGEHEKHRVFFSWNQMWGGLKVAVDGTKIASVWGLYTGRLVRSFEFNVGVEEKHAVRIDKTMKRFLPGLRPQMVTAMVDGHIVVEEATNVWRQVILTFAVAITVVVGVFILLVNR